MAVDLGHPLGKLVAYARLYQHCVFPGPDQQRIESDYNPVLLVGNDLLRPHSFWNHAEECAPIKTVGSVREAAQFEVAKAKTLHKWLRSCVKATLLQFALKVVLNHVEQLSARFGSGDAVRFVGKKHHSELFACLYQRIHHLNTVLQVDVVITCTVR